MGVYPIIKTQEKEMISGKVHIEVYDKDGNKKIDIEKPNEIRQRYKNQIAYFLVNKDVAWANTNNFGTTAATHDPDSEIGLDTSIAFRNGTATSSTTCHVQKAVSNPISHSVFEFTANEGEIETDDIKRATVLVTRGETPGYTGTSNINSTFHTVWDAMFIMEQNGASVITNNTAGGYHNYSVESKFKAGPGFADQTSSLDTYAEFTALHLGILGGASDLSGDGGIESTRQVYFSTYIAQELLQYGGSATNDALALRLKRGDMLYVSWTIKIRGSES